MRGQYTYERDKTEALLTAYWNGGTVVNELAPDQDMPNAKKNPAHGGDLLAEMADINRAMDKAPLSRDEHVALFLVYGHGWFSREVGARTGVSRQMIDKRVESGLAKVIWALNGGWKHPED